MRPTPRIGEADRIDAGEWTVCHFMGRGTNDGPLGPLPANGRPASVPMAEILHWNEGGQITEGATFYDRLSMLIQLGYAEEPPTA
ncbi:MAG TPA: ester cyclase [Actinomycetota bacterium]|nr:ester cyclase [Actinomycetota bacterium]